MPIAWEDWDYRPLLDSIDTNKYHGMTTGRKAKLLGKSEWKV